MLMQFLRKFLLVLITPLFSLLLFATAFNMGLLRTVNQPANVKKIIADSGVYDTAVNGLLEQAKQISDKGDGSVSLNNPIIHSAANTTFTPQFLQTNTETVLDSVYAWLNGKTPQPDFKIDLTDPKNQFAAAVAKSVETRAASLPACTATNTPSDFDGLTAKCLPAGLTPAAAGNEVQANIVGGKGFLDHPVINANSVKSSNSKRSIFTDQLKDVPKQYQRVKKVPLVLSILTLLVAVAIVFLSSSRRKGLRHVGVSLLVIGGFMLAFAWALNWGVSKKAVPKITLNNAVVQKDIRNLVTDVSQKIDQNYWFFGGLYAGLGVLAIGSAMAWGGKGPSKKDEDSLKGEGKTPEDRIDLKESDKPTPLADTKPAAKHLAKPIRRTPAEPGVKRTIKVQ